MTVLLDRPQTAPAGVRSSRWAWVAILSSPVSGVVAIWMSFFVLGDENIKWWGNLIVVALVFLPPVAGIVLGLRSARSGNRLGTHAMATSAAWLGFMLMFWYAANYPYNSESSVMPLSLGALTALVLAAGAEVWDRLARRRSHRT